MNWHFNYNVFPFLHLKREYRPLVEKNFKNNNKDGFSVPSKFQPSHSSQCPVGLVDIDSNRKDFSTNKTKIYFTPRPKLDGDKNNNDDLCQYNFIKHNIATSLDKYGSP